MSTRHTLRRDIWVHDQRNRTQKRTQDGGRLARCIPHGSSPSRLIIMTAALIWIHCVFVLELALKFLWPYWEAPIQRSMAQNLSSAWLQRSRLYPPVLEPTSRGSYLKFTLISARFNTYISTPRPAEESPSRPFHPSELSFTLSTHSHYSRHIRSRSGAAPVSLDSKYHIRRGLTYPLNSAAPVSLVFKSFVCR